MFKLENDKEREAIKLLNKNKIAIALKDILKRELNFQHKCMENETETNNTNIYKGRCQIIRSFYKLFNSEDGDKVDDFIDVPDKVENVKKVGKIIKFLNYFKLYRIFTMNPIK